MRETTSMTITHFPLRRYQPRSECGISSASPHRASSRRADSTTAQFRAYKYSVGLTNYTTKGCKGSGSNVYSDRKMPYMSKRWSRWLYAFYWIHKGACGKLTHA